MTDFVSEIHEIVITKAQNGYLLVYTNCLHASYTEVYMTWDNVMKRLASFIDKEMT